MSCSNRNGQVDQPAKNDPSAFSQNGLNPTPVTHVVEAWARPWPCAIGYLLPASFTLAFRFSQRNVDSLIRRRQRCIIERDFVTMAFVCDIWRAAEEMSFDFFRAHAGPFLVRAPGPAAPELKLGRFCLIGVYRLSALCLDSR
jgi:hypothetical protein